VLVIGGGQSGLCIAARLKQLQVVHPDRRPRSPDRRTTGANRYHALTLHNQVQVNHLPYMPFPPNWPGLYPKDNSPTGSSLCRKHGAEFLDRHRIRGRPLHEKEARWTVVLRRADGSKRTMHPRHVVLGHRRQRIPSLARYPA